MAAAAAASGAVTAVVMAIEWEILWVLPVAVARLL